MIILLHSMRFRRMEEWRISDSGWKKSRGDSSGNVEGNEQKDPLNATWPRLVPIKTLFFAQPGRNPSSRQNWNVTRRFTRARMCVYVYTRLLTNCESSHASAIVAADWNPHHVPRRSHLPSSRLPTTWILRNIYGIYKMEDNKQTLNPRHRFLLVKQNRGCGWSLFPVFPFWDTRICANDRFIFVLNFNFINKDIWTNWTINLIHFFFRSIITILYHSFDYYRLVSLVLSLSLLLLSN